MVVKHNIAKITLLSFLLVVSFTKNSLSATEKCQKWLSLYNDAAIIVGDLSNLGKIQYICNTKEAQPLWDSLDNDMSYCQERGCYMSSITGIHWGSMNQKINNIYNYLKSKK